MNKFELNISTIIDNINCLKELISKDENAEAIFALSMLLRPVFSENWPIYIAGIGKPSYIAQKQAATLKSIMCNATFIDASLAGHGDIGPIPVDNCSILLIISKSGCSTELFSLCSMVKQLRPKCQIVMLCMSTNEQYTIVQQCNDIDVVARLYVEPNELDGNGIIPSTSNAVFEVVLSTAIDNAIQNTIGITTAYERLKNSHPNGTLYNKVSEVLSEAKNLHQ